MSVPITSGASGSAGVLPQATPAAAGTQVVETPPPVAPASGPQKPTQQQLQAAMKEVQEQVRNSAQNLQFSLDDETGKTVVRVVDAENGEVIRQIPSEELMAIAKSIGQMQGLLLRQKA